MSGRITTREPVSSLTPVGANKSTGGRTTGTGTRRGKPASSTGVSTGWALAAGSVVPGRCRRHRLRHAVADEADDVVEGRVVAQLQRLVAFDAVGLADLGEQLGLLDGVDAEVRFEVQVEVEELGRVAGLVGHQRHHPGRQVLTRRLERCRLRRRGRDDGSGRSGRLG